MPANAIPLSLDAAFVMNLRDFILVLDDSGTRYRFDGEWRDLEHERVRLAARPRRPKAATA